MNLLAHNPDESQLLLITVCLFGCVCACVCAQLQMVLSSNFLFSSGGRIRSEVCMGTVIGPRHVLTSAGCLYSLTELAWHGHVEFRISVRQNEGRMLQVLLNWEKVSMC